MTCRLYDVGARQACPPAIGAIARQPGAPGRARDLTAGRRRRGPGPHPAHRDPRRSRPGADLVIEAATEDEAIKKSIFRDLTPHLGADTLLASNTSSISITRLASATDRPERFIGLHFMKPAPVMKLVEIIRGIATSGQTYETAVAFAESLGKTTTNVRGLPRLHRQPHPGADDQRGDLHPVRGRRERRRDRHGPEAGRQPSDGAAGAGRLHGPGRRAGHHERALRGPGATANTGPARCW